MGLRRVQMRFTRLARPGARTAQALVELVIVLPFLLVVISAVLHFGLLLYVLIGLHSAVTSASLYASAHPTNNTAILNAVSQSLPAVVDQSTVTTTVLFSTDRKYKSLMTLRVDYDITFLQSLPFGAFIPAPTEASAIVTIPILAN